MGQIDLTNLQPGKRYAVMVRAFDEHGNYSGNSISYQFTAPSKTLTNGQLTSTNQYVVTALAPDSASTVGGALVAGALDANGIANTGSVNLGSVWNATLNTASGYPGLTGSVGGAVVINSTGILGYQFTSTASTGGSSSGQANFFLDTSSGNAYFRGTIYANAGNIGTWNLTNNVVRTLKNFNADQTDTASLVGTVIENIALGQNDYNTNTGIYTALFSGSTITPYGYTQQSAGLYLRDYSSNTFDYGFIGSDGLYFQSSKNYNFFLNSSTEGYPSGTGSNTPYSWTASGTGYNQLKLDVINKTSPALFIGPNSTYGYLLTWTASVDGTVSPTISASSMYKNGYLSTTSDLSLVLNFNFFNYLSKGFSPYASAQVVSITNVANTYPYYVTASTSTSHGLVANDMAYLSFTAYDSGSSTSYFTNDNVVTVASVTSTTFTYKPSYVYIAPTAPYILDSPSEGVSILNVPAALKIELPVFDIGKARIRFPNGASVSLFSVLTSKTSASWDNIRYFTNQSLRDQATLWYSGAGTSNILINSTYNRSPITISSASLAKAYQIQDPTNYANIYTTGANIYLDLPGYLNAGSAVWKDNSGSAPGYWVIGTSNASASRKLSSSTSTASYGIIFDDISLTKTGDYFDGDYGSGYHYVDDDISSPAKYFQASLKDPLTTISYSNYNNNGDLYFDKISNIGFINSYSRALYDTAKITPTSAILQGPGSYSSNNNIQIFSGTYDNNNNLYANTTNDTWTSADDTGWQGVAISGSATSYLTSYIDNTIQKSWIKAQANQINLTTDALGSAYNISGFTIAPWKANKNYLALTTPEWVDGGNSRNYIILSDGINTFISSASTGSLYLRGGANSSTAQIQINPTSTSINGSVAVNGKITSGSLPVLIDQSGTGLVSYGIGTASAAAPVRINHGLPVGTTPISVIATLRSNTGTAGMVSTGSYNGTSFLLATYNSAGTAIAGAFSFAAYA
jgi:hypothetical protein